MTIADMHYELNTKLNKLDAQAYRNLRIPEKDWKLNEAMILFARMVANPRVAQHLGLEKNQRTIDDIRTLVTDNAPVTLSSFTSSSYKGALPEDYFHFISFDKISVKKDDCTADMEEIVIRQHNDTFEDSPFDSSSFEWRAINVTFFEDGVRFYTDGTFSVEEVRMNYLRKPAYMHWAAGYTGGTYTLPGSQVLTGQQNCELPWQVHHEIVDLAVLLISGEIQAPDFQTKQLKLQLAGV